MVFVAAFWGHKNPGDGNKWLLVAWGLGGRMLSQQIKRICLVAMWVGEQILGQQAMRGADRGAQFADWPPCSVQCAVCERARDSLCLWHRLCAVQCSALDGQHCSAAVQHTNSY